MSFMMCRNYLLYNINETEETKKNGKLRDFGNIGYRTQNKEKQKLVCAH